MQEEKQVILPAAPMNEKDAECDSTGPAGKTAQGQSLGCLFLLLRAMTGLRVPCDKLLPGAHFHV